MPALPRRAAEVVRDTSGPRTRRSRSTISTGLPVFRSYSVRSTAQPRLCREPFDGSATKLWNFSGVASQNIFVTCHGR